MCGRFALYSDFPSLAAALKLPLAEGELMPRYNVALGTWISAVRRHDDGGQQSMNPLWWGYRPHWADDKAPEPITAAWYRQTAGTSGWRRMIASSPTT